MENLKGKSMDLTEDNLNKLKELFPEVFEEGKIDFDKLRLILGDEVDDNEERYEFTWHGKNNAIRIAQTPSTGTLRPDKESSKNWDDTENLYIEGDNLEVLKLLQKSYFGKVKMIYIDPPYNTGKDFVYHDNFRDNIANYKEITNQSTKANPETNGRYHTDWLNMMYPRLKLARNLLRDDGVIFISIDDNEVENLKKLCNEIFGESNFVGTYIWKNKSGGGGKQGKNNPNKQNTKNEAFVIDHEYILCYVKNKALLDRFNVDLSEDDMKKYINIDNDIRGPYVLEDLERSIPTPISTLYYTLTDPDGIEISPKGGKFQWRRSQERVLKEIKTGEIIWHKVKSSKDSRGYYYRPKTKQYLYDENGKIRTKSARSVLTDIALTRDGAIELRQIFNGEEYFDYPKPTKLIKYIFNMVLENNDIVMDFFSGTGTTAHSAMSINIEKEKNIKYIIVQLPESTKNLKIKNNIHYKNICEVAKERIRRAGDKIVSENKDKEGIENLDIGFKVFKLDSSNLKSWDSSMDNLEQNLLDMVSNLKQDRTNEDLLYEILLKSGVELTAKIEEIKVGYNTLYNIGCGALLVCLDDKITQDVIDEIPKHKSPFMDTKVIFKEAGFMSDAAKINAVQNLKQFKIEDVRSV